VVPFERIVRGLAVRANVESAAVAFFGHSAIFGPSPAILRIASVTSRLSAISPW